jgi:hypothetical protein
VKQPKTRRISSKRRPSDVHSPRQAKQPALTEEWWNSWRRANALGWEYLDAVTGLFRVNVDALTSATRFMTPFRPQ